MESHRVIITAQGVDIKLINRLLLTLRDWEFGDEPHWDQSKILCTKEDACREAGQDGRDEPPLQEFQQNQWQGVSLREIEQFMLQNPREKDTGQRLFTVLDDQGVQDETVIIARRRINSDFREQPQASLYLDEYQKTRVPWIEAHSMLCNLELANMDFEDFVDDDSGDGEGWWIYRPIESAEHYTKYLSRRNAVLKELTKLDLA